MIPLRYREMLPPYMYEIDMVERHFMVMEQEIDEREKKIDDIGDQFILQRATWALSAWEWIYFRQESEETLEQRREGIRRKRWAKRPFKLSALRLLGAQHGKLLNVIEAFEEKEIHFEFAANSPIDVAGLFADFEYIRPVHINRSVPVAKTTTPAIVLSGQAYQYSIDFPICGFEMPQEPGTSGVLAAQSITVGAASTRARIDSPITGFELPMQGGTP
ncbi:putative phage tail protein [Paenibacillus sp. IHBB 10380]|uniref:putative phage tail protein n=1 Tax=Paenibacillus sp. IHBB 10380 TaxID=1566358 RepID=UPI0006987E24|nr:putative phage tail protein [Paenibacillus sp. IHBB 10380]